jgi:hypothetical protein
VELVLRPELLAISLKINIKKLKIINNRQPYKETSIATVLTVSSKDLI